MTIEYSDILKKLPVYAFASVSQRVAEMKRNGQKVIDCGLGDPTEPPPSFVIEGLTPAAEQRKYDGYPNYVGDAKFLEQCAVYMRDNYGVVVDPSTEICATIGSKEAAFHFPFAFVNPGEIVICPSPGYPVYYNSTIFVRGKPYLVPLLEENHFLINLKKIPVEIAKEAKIIWTNYPNSPTGVIAPKNWLEELAEWADKYNVIIAADEGCYNEFYFGEKPHSMLEITKKNVITFYSLSKRSNMTTYRIGFVAGEKHLVDGFKKVKTNVDSGTPTFIQDVAILALADKTHPEYMLNQYNEKRKIIIQALEKAGFELPIGDSTFYLWIKAKDGDGLRLSQRFLDSGIVVTYGGAISHEVDGVNPGAQFVRMALMPNIEDIRFIAHFIENELGKM